jgi:DNA polymerase-3 subunit delta'
MSKLEVAHPRDVTRLEGSEVAEQAFLDALERGRLHHAWLLVGPEGVGKATFAYRAARRLLGARPDSEFGVLGAHPDDPVFRQVAGRAHPDLMVLELENPDGKARKSIPVDEARALPEFFSKSPGRAAHRVAIIDAVDDLNTNAANAVLKTLEEPPPRGVLFLISHRPGSLLPTIRSRCRRLVFTPPPADVAARWLTEAATDVSIEAAHGYLRMARGAPGRALRLSATNALEIDEAARELVEKLPAIDQSEAGRAPRASSWPWTASPPPCTTPRLAPRSTATAPTIAAPRPGAWSPTCRARPTLSTSTEPTPSSPRSSAWRSSADADRQMLIANADR